MAVSPIPRKRVTSSFSAWLNSRPKPGHVQYHLQRIVESAPREWQGAIRSRFLKSAPLPPAGVALDSDAYARWYLGLPSESEQAWMDLQELADYEDRYGDALRLNMGDGEICAWAAKLADDVEELENRCIALGGGLPERLALVRGIVHLIGVDEGKPLDGEPAIARAKCARWWRRRLRRHIARVVEAGAISMGLVHLNSGGYVSHSGLKRRKGQLARNADALGRTLYKNEAGQVYSLAELAALSTSNPSVRGGELMTRIRGAEEYADAHGHLGLFLTLTLPSKYHAMRLMGSGANRWAARNPKHNGATPRDGQQWMLAQWKRVLAKLDRQQVKRYGLRVVEPHHDGTPHWHMLVWVEGEAQARTLVDTIRKYWLSEDGNERGAKENRVDVKRMNAGGAAGYVAKYIAKNVGHHALAEHQDVVQGQEIQMVLGLDSPNQPASPEALESNGLAAQRRVDAWAATWNIRQFQAFGMPSVTVWRELRRVSKDQPEQVELFDREAKRNIQRAYQACHRHGDLRADWRTFMESMGGHGCKRQDWLLCPARRAPKEGATNMYGDPITAGPVRGVQVQRGRGRGHWLVSRRIAWAHCTDATPAVHAAGVAADADGVIHSVGQEAQTRRPLGAAWTGFNNFTARLQSQSVRDLFGRGRHEAEDWNSPSSPDSVLYRPATATASPASSRCS
ncbi:replication endonuclease [Delftia sp. WSY_4]|uniref:replication endonuclease n=1 Tax=unclassified Delftia TaxID=2613839 RepID=UPI00370CA4A6